MKRLLLLGMLLSCSMAVAEQISVMPLTMSEPIKIPVGTNQATILQFPRNVNGLLGYGLTDGTEPGTYHYTHPKNSNLLTLRNVMPGKEAKIGVLLGRDLVLLHLEPSDEAPAVIRLADLEKRQLRQARKISVSQVDGKKLDYSTEKLLQLLRLARNERVFQAYLPHLHDEVESRRVELTYDAGDTASVIRQLYRFPKEDALVLLGEIQNRLDYPIRIDPGSFEVRVAERVYPVVLVDASETVPANGAIPVHVVIKGDTEGNRANLSIKNDFRLIPSNHCRYEQMEEWAGYIDPSLFGNTDRPDVVTIDKKGGK